MAKRCTKCLEEKPLSAFHKNKRHPQGVNCHCKECIREYGASRKEERREYLYYWGIKKRYGLTKEDVESLREAQADRCAICKELFNDRPRIDHCHETNEVRGLLCHCCNTALGLFKDNPANLRAAIQYLE